MRLNGKNQLPAHTANAVGTLAEACEVQTMIPLLNSMPVIP